MAVGLVGLDRRLGVESILSLLLRIPVGLLGEPRLGLIAGAGDDKREENSYG